MSFQRTNPNDLFPNNRLPYMCERTLICSCILIFFSYALSFCAVHFYFLCSHAPLSSMSIPSLKLCVNTLYLLWSPKSFLPL